MAAKISVIVPVYNAGKTLPTCLGNLMNQTLADIEYILVNDASTDNSLSILMDCERAFPDKVFLINLEENLGPGGARNIGLSYASGDYIGFIDSDDLADTAMYEKLYKCAVEGDYDMVDGAFYYEEKDQLRLYTGDDCTGILNPYKRAKLIIGGGYLWSRIYKREIFDDIIFREHTILEDMESLMLIFLKCKKIGSVKDVVYKYCYYPNSASKLSNPDKVHKALCHAMTAVGQSVLSMVNDHDIRLAVEYSILVLYQHGIVNSINPKNKLADLKKNVYLRELQALRMKYVEISYADNIFVQNKISAADLELMKEADLL